MRVLTQDKKNIYDCEKFYVVEGKNQTIGFDPYYKKFSIVGEKDDKFVNLGIYETAEEAESVKDSLDSHESKQIEGTFPMPVSKNR